MMDSAGFMFAEVDLENARLALLDALRASAAVERDEILWGPAQGGQSALSLLVTGEVERTKKAFIVALERWNVLRDKSSEG